VKQADVPGVFSRPLAIVDVETTGQSALYGRVIDVAVLRVEGGKVVRRFTTLVNPRRPITPMIEGLTGITNRELAGAPGFRSIARELAAVLADAVFVAHNARFDYSFLKAEFAHAGLPFSARQLCTVKLSRALFPAHRRHDLSTLIERHGLTCRARHRALGDAEAVLAFLQVVDTTIGRETAEAACRKILKTSAVPSGLDPAEVDALPEGPGVYLFYGERGEVLYVGKSVHVRERVRSHFTADGTSAKEMEMARQIHRVEVQRTAGELGALLLESRLIKELGPVYNTASRRRRSLLVARRSLTADGYAAVRLEELDRIDVETAASVLALYKSRRQAETHLDGLARTHRLCKKLLGLDQGRDHCFGYHLRQCAGACAGEEDAAAYNARLDTAFEERRVRAWPYPGEIVIEEWNAETGEREVFHVDNWCLLASIRTGMEGDPIETPGEYRFDYDSYKIILRQIMAGGTRNRVRVVRRPAAVYARE
jgi:DNA polymerase-3 subunit epsilon